MLDDLLGSAAALRRRRDPADRRDDHDRVVSGTKRFLHERFGAEHTTLQVEYTDECVDHAPPPDEEEQVR